MQYIDKKHFYEIEEYRFDLIHVKAILENYQDVELYFRFNKRGRMKETIFCYWRLLNEERLKNKQDKNNKNKVAILAEESTPYQSTLKLEVNEEKHKIESYSEIYFIDIVKFLKDNNISENQIEQWNNFLPFGFNELLFIGKVDKE